MRNTLGLAAAAAIAAASPAAAAGPPLPHASNGKKVQVAASGVPTPTSFAFGGGKAFVGAFGNEEKPTPKGGVFWIHRGKATRLTTGHVFGLAWRKGRLYVADGTNLLVYAGWNGKRFTRRRALWKRPATAPTFNGLRFGPDGRLYAGVSFSDAAKYDNARDPAPYAQSVISLRTSGRKDVRIEARGLRQPFQLAFVKGRRGPYVTVLGEDSDPNSIPPDWIVEVKRGRDYGFPTCPGTNVPACKAFARPFKLLPRHASPMGIGAIGQRLYVALFGGLKGKPEVVTIPAGGGAAKPFLTGFVAPVVGLGTWGHTVYVGDLTGRIYRVHA